MCKFIHSKKPPLPISLVRIKKELKTKRKNAKDILTCQERNLIEEIYNKTNEQNKNNVTRTKAYLDFYLRYPEIHWAFLGHMVSRNGGWNMTDLKGELLSNLLSTQEANNFFTFLERGNWLIFQDAYPQFLLYEESLKKGQNLFYLLPHFHVSSFMETIWNDFWKYRDTYLLTVALIINEQSYLESRVINNDKFKKEVFDSLEFRLQDILSMNHILFPYEENGGCKLRGETLHHFESLHERILLGKRLYSILFTNEKRKKLIEDWAIKTIHTGSRKDYWDSIFNDIREGKPGTIFKRRLKKCRLLPESNRFYSPQLTMVWKDQNHKKAELGDWYNNWKVVYYLIPLEEIIDGEVENDYCKTLERLELAAVTKKAISVFD